MTFEDKVVNESTNPVLQEPDLQRNLRVADLINNARDKGSAMLDAILHRMKHKDDFIIVLSIQLLDMCVKNGSSGFLKLVRDDSRIAPLLSGYIHGSTPTTREAALNLLVTLESMFEGHFSNMKHELEEKGIEIPELSNPPIETPERHHFPSDAIEVSQLALSVDAAYMQKLANDLMKVLEYVDIARRLLSDGNAISEVKSVFLQVQQRFLVLLMEVDDEKVVAVVLELNELVQDVLDACDGDDMVVEFDKDALGKKICECIGICGDEEEKCDSIEQKAMEHGDR